MPLHERSREDRQSGGEASNFSVREIDLKEQRQNMTVISADGVMLVFALSAVVSAWSGHNFFQLMMLGFLRVLF